uniref:Uncharacterized protein n=1 Tax=Solanum lycopersicum TaxID=4081 RepID=A0A3Q7II74_SOLLC
SSKLHKLQ